MTDAVSPPIAFLLLELRQEGDFQCKVLNVLAADLASLNTNKTTTYDEALKQQNCLVNALRDFNHARAMISELELSISGTNKSGKMCRNSAAPLIASVHQCNGKPKWLLRQQEVGQSGYHEPHSLCSPKIISLLLHQAILLVGKIWTQAKQVGGGRVCHSLRMRLDTQ